jgi:hypothetical protein
MSEQKQNGPPNINPATQICMLGGGRPVMLISESPMYPPIQELTERMGLRRTRRPHPSPDYHPGHEVKDDDVEPPNLVGYDDDDGLPNLVGCDDGDGLPNLVGCDDCDDNVHVPEKKKKIQGTSNVSSKIDNDGNIEIKVIYDSNSYKCCVCNEGIVGPISSCENSHPLCSECIMGIEKTGDHRCPMCRSSTKGRNYLLENALLDMIKTCPFTKQGCRHRSYPENMKEHTTICRYAEIDCPWCGEKTTPFDLQTHTESLCKKQFSEMSCSNSIDFIKSDRITNVYMLSVMEESRILYVEKTKTECKIMCIQGKDRENQINSIVMTYNIDVGSLGGMKLTETRKIMLPIHRPGNLTGGNVLMHTIPLKELAGYKDIVITGFKEKYMAGGRWMVEDCKREWYRATILERLYNPDRILATFDNHDTRWDEWIEITNGESKRIRPLTAKYGRTTREELRYMDNLTDTERVRLIMERSMIEM